MPCLTTVLVWIYVSSHSTIYQLMPVPFCFDKPPLRCAISSMGRYDKRHGIVCLDDNKQVILDTAYMPPIKS